MGAFELNTPEGTDVQVMLDSIATVTFSIVTTGGYTTLTVTEIGPGPPAGFELLGQYYNITTTATVGEGLTIRIQYDETLIPPEGAEQDIVLMYYEERAGVWGWYDVTYPGYPDTIDNIIQGTVDYLSLFAVMLPLNQPPVADAGFDQTVEQESYEGAEVTLDGSGSTDLDSTPDTNDDIYSFDWFEEGTHLGSGEVIDITFPLDEHTVTLVVTDSAGETDEDEVIIVVQDTTPPNVKIEYPSDGARVFMDEEIDVIYDVSDIRNPDLAVTVTPEDPISPPLPIGELTITVTATDAYGNEGSDSVTVEVLGPAGIKEDAVTQLDAVETSSRRVDRVINKVIGLIDKSLGDRYWVDDLHLDAKRGCKVFMYESLAVGKMKHHIKRWDKRGPTEEQEQVIGVFEAVTTMLVKADKLLAETAMDEANDAEDPWNPGKLRAYNRFLAKADRAFDKALHLADNDRPKRAIRSFKQAWKNAQQAMKMAQ